MEKFIVVIESLRVVTGRVVLEKFQVATGREGMEWFNVLIDKFRVVTKPCSKAILNHSLMFMLVPKQLSYQFQGCFMPSQIYYFCSYHYWREWWSYENSILDLHNEICFTTIWPFRRALSQVICSPKIIWGYHQLVCCCVEMLEAQPSNWMFIVSLWHHILKDKWCFWRWNYVIFAILRILIPWPLQESVCVNISQIFADLYSHTRCIIDCYNKIFIECPEVSYWNHT